MIRTLGLILISLASGRLANPPSDLLADFSFEKFATNFHGYIGDGVSKTYTFSDGITLTLTGTRDSLGQTDIHVSCAFHNVDANLQSLYDRLDKGKRIFIDETFVLDIAYANRFEPLDLKASKAISQSLDGLSARGQAIAERFNTRLDVLESALAVNGEISENLSSLKAYIESLDIPEGQVILEKLDTMTSKIEHLRLMVNNLSSSVASGFNDTKNRIREATNEVKAHVTTHTASKDDLNLTFRFNQSLLQEFENRFGEQIVSMESIATKNQTNAEAVQLAIGTLIESANNVDTLIDNFTSRLQASISEEVESAVTLLNPKIDVLIDNTTRAIGLWDEKVGYDSSLSSDISLFRSEFLARTNEIRAATDLLSEYLDSNSAFSRLLDSLKSVSALLDEKVGSREALVDALMQVKKTLTLLTPFAAAKIGTSAVHDVASTRLNNANLDSIKNKNRITI
jgi:hypothetical protein